MSVLVLAGFLAVAVFPMAILLVTVLGWQRWLDPDRGRRQPFDELPKGRWPGVGIRRRLMDAGQRWEALSLQLAMVGPLVLGVWAALRLHRLGELTLDLVGALLFVAAGGWSAWAAWRLVAIGRERRRFIEALRAEHAVAQYLQPLLAQGWVIFHDLPAEGFNIDHIAIGPNGVFAIETKSRKKPPRDVKEGHRVRFDGRALHFPDHSTSKPVEQAQRQARWLERELASGTGESVKVVPVLALPGWFVESSVRQSASDGFVLAGKALEGFLPKASTGMALDVKQRQRIAHVLTLRYTDNTDAIA